MTDGPFNFDSGHIFESQKGISDRRAAQGFPPGPGGGAQWSSRSARGAVSTGSGTLGDFILKAIVFLMVAGLILGLVASVAIVMAGAWLLFHLVRAMLGGRGRRRWR